MNKRFNSVTIVVLMVTGAQRMTQVPVYSLPAIGRAFRDALDAGAVEEAVVISRQEGIVKYNSYEVTACACDPAFA